MRGATLFLDLDGTLLELVDRPEEVRADAKLVALLEKLAAFLDGRIAIVSGRSIDQLDAILGRPAANFALSGSHGSEHRWKSVLARPQRPAELDIAAKRMRQFGEHIEGVIVEEKSYGVALHYRMAQAEEQAACALAQTLADELNLAVQPGKMMVELRVPGGDKGTAIAAMMRRAPMAGTRPVFAGDDLTDEPGFAVASGLGGSGILVGTARPTAARYCVDGPAALRRWLWLASQ